MGTWKQVDTGIWTRIYSFGGNPINTLVIDMGDGNLMAISPGTDVPDADFDELDGLGTVSALVCPGAFHHMGLPSWSERYPEARLFGPGSAIAHVAKQHPDLKPLEDLSELKPLLSDDFVLEELPGCKHPDLFLSVTRGGHTTWVSNELLSNNAAYPSGFVLKWAFKLSGNHPGLNCNTLAGMLIGAKKPVVREFYERKLQSNPPTRLLPIHGAVLESDHLVGELGDVLARRL